MASFAFSWYLFLFLWRLQNSLVSATVNASGTTPCLAISSALPGKVFFQENTAYVSSLGSYYSAQEEEINPACVVIPTCTADVSTALVILNDIHSSNSSSGGFAIRSGGHGIFAGDANIENGVTIDLSQFNSTDFIQPDKSVVRIGAGARWTTVYEVLDPYNLTVLGGRTPSVGVGGYLPGGGLSFLSQRFGWACDAENTIGYEVVLASGQVVYANASGPYSDLFLALKGGLNNLGIVTRFDMTTYSLGQMWGGFVLYPIAILDSMLSAYSDFMDPDNYDRDADMVFAVGYLNPGWVPILNLGMQYTKPVADPPVFRSLYNASVAEDDTMRIASLTNITAEEDAHNPSGYRQIYMTSTFAHTPEIYARAWDLFNSSADQVFAVANITYVFILQPTPILNGTNSLGLNASDIRLNIALVSVSWTNSEDDELVTNTVTDFFTALKALATDSSVDRDFIYANYAYKTQDPIDGYGAENKARLQAASKKYDAGGLFQTGVPGGFKLFV
ncbi:Bifunctional solanapyrone synthase [Lachnellula arida]|uniref:Bifunctional solanapyrone synthase n=1 Tax=Lachnellula arida TaxID=1316785 RepID=A0A8T9BPF8_9HELO|nr:Bifunctional solanapyrone synthase [Lachnellula arida]